MTSYLLIIRPSDQLSIYYMLHGVPSPVDSILLAVLTVSPNKQYLGIFTPTIPATTGPNNTHVLVLVLVLYLYSQTWVLRITMRLCTFRLVGAIQVVLRY